MNRVEEMNAQLRSFPYVVRIEISHQEGSSQPVSVLLSLQNDKKEILEATFGGVVSLRFRSEEVRLYGCKLIMVEDASSLGWDKVRYKVKDYEEEFISFFCNTVALRA